MRLFGPLLAACAGLALIGSASCAPRSEEKEAAPGVSEKPGEVWVLKGNTAKEAGRQTVSFLKDLATDMKEAPTYIQGGIDSLEQSQKGRDAQVEKALQSLNPDSAEDPFAPL